MTASYVSVYYVEGIKSGRQSFQIYGMQFAKEEVENIKSTIKRGFGASGPVGQFLRGERDFWLNQINRAALSRVKG